MNNTYKYSSEKAFQILEKIKTKDHNPEIDLTLIEKLHSSHINNDIIFKIEKLLRSSIVPNRSKSALLLLLKEKGVNKKISYKKNKKYRKISPTDLPSLELSSLQDEITSRLSSKWTKKNNHLSAEINTIISDLLFDLYPANIKKNVTNFNSLTTAILYFINNKFQLPSEISEKKPISIPTIKEKFI